MTEWNPNTGLASLAANAVGAPFDGGVWVSVIIGLLLALNVATIVILLVYVRRAGRAIRHVGPAGRTDHPTDRAFVALRDQSLDISQGLARLSGMMTSIGVQMTDFHRGFEQFTFGRWEEYKQLQQNCQQMVRGLIAARDRIEQLRAGRIPPENITTLAETCSLDIREALAQAGIVEISVQLGQPADSSVHKTVGVRGDSQPEGIVLDVVRHGYCVGAERDAATVIRPAEVIVSGGPALPEASAVQGMTGTAHEAAVDGRPPREEAATASDGLRENLPRKDAQPSAPMDRQDKRRPSASNRKDGTR
jgi:hypothetical protein